MNKQEKIKPLFWLRKQRHETSANDEESIKNSSIKWMLELILRNMTHQEILLPPSHKHLPI
jgi:hypothetical protein